MGRQQLAGIRRPAGEILLLALALGVATGVLWLVLAPGIRGEVTGDGVAVPLVEARRQFGVDGWFAVLAAAGGLVLGAVSFARHRRRPVTTLIVLVLAGLAAAAVQWGVGGLLGPDPVPAGAAEPPTGTLVDMPLEVSATAALLVWPISGVVAALAVAALFDDRAPWRARLSRRERSEPSSPP